VASKAERTLGAVTVNGPLHLTQTSPAAIPGLLAGMEKNSAKPARSNQFPKLAIQNTFQSDPPCEKRYIYESKGSPAITMRALKAEE
jgi:hypothetical protein